MKPTTQAPGHRRNHERRTSAEALIRYTHTLLDAVGTDRSPSWVARAVRDYERRGLRSCTYGTWLTDRLNLTAIQRHRSEVAYLLGYADPTGEAAVNNVMKGTTR